MILTNKPKVEFYKKIRLIKYVYNHNSKVKIT